MKYLIIILIILCTNVKYSYTSTIAVDFFQDELILFIEKILDIENCETIIYQVSVDDTLFNKLLKYNVNDDISLNFLLINKNDNVYCIALTNDRIYKPTYLHHSKIFNFAKIDSTEMISKEYDDIIFSAMGDRTSYIFYKNKQKSILFCGDTIYQDPIVFNEIPSRKILRCQWYYIIKNEIINMLNDNLEYISIDNSIFYKIYVFLSMNRLK